MRSNNAFFGVIAALVVLLGFTTYLAFRGGANKDGNPIGYDVTGTPTGAAPATSAAGCLETHSCRSIAIHYMRIPAGSCPTPVPAALLTPEPLCSPAASPVRVLPDCPKGAQCITFTGKGSELTLMTQDDDGFHYHQSAGKAIIILKP